MEKLAIGIMSGTSLDGIDVVIAKIKGVSLTTRVTQIAFKTYPFKDDLLNQIKQAMDHKTSSSESLCSLNVRLGHAFAHAAISLCNETGIHIEDIDFIASHGQTIYHITNHDNDLVPSSLQLGDGSVISQLTKTTVVSNFRNADIAQGGQGAPLVPFADYVLFRSEHASAIHNIGGISNLTYLPRRASKDEIIAFDTGPGNMMIDAAMQLLYDLPYDKDGMIAQSGQIIDALAKDILKDPYFKKRPPKSTGRERFGFEQTKTWINPYLKYPKADIIKTLTYVTARSIINAYEDFIIKTHLLDQIIMCGGGASNRHLIDMIQDGLPQIEIKMLETSGYHRDAKEALAFIILGNQTLYKEPSNIPSATGAKQNVILGQISYYK
jgi:anhydro-N-acetylmuramic acid kinase